jgi:hypothetical protein
MHSFRPLFFGLAASAYSLLTYPQQWLWLLLLLLAFVVLLRLTGWVRWVMTLRARGYKAGHYSRQGRGYGALVAALKSIRTRKKLTDMELQNVAINAMSAAAPGTDPPPVPHESLRPAPTSPHEVGSCRNGASQ